MGTTQSAYLAVPVESVSDPAGSEVSNTNSTDTNSTGSSSTGSTSAERLRPLVVSLHSWSSDMEQRQPELERLIAEKKWFCLQPNFRGINNRPEACGSPAAQQDVIDAVDRVIEDYPIDPQRVYLTGTSGGGHMTMLLAANFPERWAAASAWVGISDMAAWYGKHQSDKYGAMTRACCGGAPGDSAAVDAQYRSRSPLTHLAKARTVVLDIAAGIHDGHTGSVPVRHSLEAFNAIAQAVGGRQISDTEIDELSEPSGRLTHPKPGDVGFDLSFARQTYLRRQAGKARVTIFEGGHEGIASAAIDWFASHAEPDKSHLPAVD